MSTTTVPNHPSDAYEVVSLPSASFGGVVRLRADAGARRLIATAEENPSALTDIFYASGGLLLLPGMHHISEEPKLLVRLSRLFGREVENNLDTYTEGNQTLFNIHQTVPEILLVTNLPPICRQPMARPDPRLTEDGEFPTRFPHRRGWHTDQSFRRPPPDISLFYAVQPTPKGQGQTMFADATGAYSTLSEELRQRVENLEGMHALPGTNRSETAVRDGLEPKELAPHQAPQRQPLVRIHPVTGKPALYMCESGQMDWVTGPIADMEPGPGREGAKLVYELMTHITQYTYTHDWDPGDLIIYDNRNLLHAPTWYEAEKYTRVMWRTTVRGNPGPEYDGEKASWIPA